MTKSTEPGINHRGNSLYHLLSDLARQKDTDLPPKAEEQKDDKSINHQ